MSEEADRNPSPPPEILTNDDLVPDRIGDSVYSKQWLYKTLMSIIELCEVNPDNQTESTSNKPAEDTVNEDAVVELDPKVEEDVCTLWDMSANEEVAHFLCECNAPDIFLEVIQKTKSPRLLEIAVGILGNMSAYDAICQMISEYRKLVYALLLLSGTSDSPTLLQVFRLIHCGVTNEHSQNNWFKAFEEHSFFMENIKFIFENCLNSNVLSRSLSLLDGMVSENMAYCRPWGEDSHTEAVIEAGRQLMVNRRNLDPFFRLLCTLSQYPPNLKKYVQIFGELRPLFVSYFLNLGEEEALPERTRIIAINSAFEVFNDILMSESIKPEDVAIDSSILKAICRLSCAVNNLINDIKRDNLQVLDFETQETEESPLFLRRIVEVGGQQFITMLTRTDFNNWSVLGETIIDATKTISTYVDKECDKLILEDIFSSEATKENVGILII